ncbi:MAG: aldehyde dehydrogenase family protein [Anaerolineae bacterium]|nr:aldehyde dehydrogenase family protein [Anaerolineae bacterium]
MVLTQLSNLNFKEIFFRLNGRGMMTGSLRHRQKRGVPPRDADPNFQEQRLDQPALPDPEVEALVSRAQFAQKTLQDWSEAQVEALLLALAQAVASQAEMLATVAVEESHIGNIADKAEKARFGSLTVYQSLVGKPGPGLISVDNEQGIATFAAPVGVVLGLIPATNPISTAIFKTLIALKARNALILSFSRRTTQLGLKLTTIIQEVLKQYGASVDLIQAVNPTQSRQQTNLLMQHRDVALILATGGPRLVNTAYRSGTPAIGVGPGNAPVLITADADLQQAATKVIQSKTFDHGVICCSEQNLVVCRQVRQPFIEALLGLGAAILTPAEVVRFRAGAIDPRTGQLRGDLVGRSAETIAVNLGIKRDHLIKLIINPTSDISPNNPLAAEKLAPVLSLVTVSDEQEGLDVCQTLLNNFGRGHTAIIHSNNGHLIQQFGTLMPASRILVNAPGATGGIGLDTGLTPSLTLGCGTFGGNSTTDNVSYEHLFNFKRLAYHRPAVEPGNRLICQVM